MALLFSPSDLTSPTASRRVRDGKLLRLARGIYCDELALTPGEAVRQHLYEIVGRVLPGAVITGRSAAAAAGPMLGDADGTIVLVVAHPDRARDLHLEGAVVRVIEGPAALPDDQPFMAPGLHLASRARQLVENQRLTRARSTLAATLNAVEVEQWLARLGTTMPPDAVAKLRADVDALAGAFPEELVVAASTLLGQLQGTATTRDGSLLTAWSAGPVDTDRLKLFDTLAEHLRALAPAVRNERATTGALPTFEAYFSNFIEGTEFTVDEAVEILASGTIAPNRPADAHDILGTFELVSDPATRASVPVGPDEFVEQLQAWHAVQMRGRPEKHPGAFKQAANRVGGFVFVAPDAVNGTLRAGFETLQRLGDPFARAVMLLFIVSEVHPFDDGNGRLARLVANAQLSAGAQTRLVFPTVFRADYLSSLRALSTGRRPEPLVRVCEFAQRWTQAIDWTDVATATADLESTHALLTSEQAADAGLRLTLPD